MSRRAAEARLALLFARRDLDDGQRDQAQRLIDSTLDWRLLLALCERHGLAPLFERHLSSLDAQGMPLKARAALWARAQSVARRNREMADELAAVVALLDANGVASIPYKGPTLALAAYGDLGLREFGDLDLLVRAADVLRAKTLLAQRGYAMPQQLTREQEEALIASSLLYELPLVDPARGVMVELHWREDPDVSVLPLADHRWWRSLACTEVSGRSVRSLSNTQLLLALCLHGTKHFWSSLGWLVDIAELMRRDTGIDSQWVRVQARANGCERRVGLGLRMAKDLLDAPVPDLLAPLTGDATVRDVARRIEESLFTEFSAPPIATALRLNLSLRDHARQRISFAWRLAVTPGWGEWLRWRLPRGLFFLYWLLRPLRLARKYWSGG
ncbi:MAG TPA: nucleotidyltransferase family protein [Usitatibacter sp.]|jgi:hypothetical protein|nr:nucleotidyltransferase family protein [Usitatibacter sp.]